MTAQFCPVLQEVLNISIFAWPGRAMDFEWDDAKERANRKKHGVGFRTAARVFLDPYVIEFDDPDATGEMRFNAIGGRRPDALRHLCDERRRRSYHIRQRSGAA